MSTKERVNVFTDKREINIGWRILLVISGAKQFDDQVSFLFSVSADSHEEFSFAVHPCLSC